MAHDVFISYSTKDKTIADAVSAKLEESKIRTWIAPRDVPAGSNYAQSIIEAIISCKVFILIWSENANLSNHILNEINEAFNNGITIIPFRIQDVEPTTEMRYYLGRTHWLDAIGPPLEKHISTLRDVIFTSLGRKPFQAETTKVPDESKQKAPEVVKPVKAEPKPKLVEDQSTDILQIKKKRTIIWIAGVGGLLTIIFLGILLGTGDNAKDEVLNDNEAANFIEDAEDELTEIPSTDVPPTEAPIPDQSAYYAVPHNVYDLGRGVNTLCSRCHSPLNWDPEAFISPAPNCISCKFEYDSEVRIAEGNPLVEEADWAGIPCETCHELDTNGTASAEIAWLNPISMQYDELNTPIELCEKCHVLSIDDAYESGIDHKITLGGSAHLIYSGFTGETVPPQYCSDCHDPHNNQAKPSCEDCHSVRNLDTHIYGNNAMHTIVSCMACHDSTDLEVGPHPDDEMNGLWVTLITTEGRSGTTISALVSHSPTHEVLCNKCHFEDNVYGLTEYTDVGEIP